MERDGSQWHERVNGTLSIIEIPADQWAQARERELFRDQFIYRWQPPYQLKCELPDWYELALLCHVCADGTRRFTPMGSALAASYMNLLGREGAQCMHSTPSLAHAASAGGSAILQDRGQVSCDRLFTYEEARLFCQFATHLSEYFGPTIRLAQSLYIPSAGRPDSLTKNILPPDLGLGRHDEEDEEDEEQESKPWNISRLKWEGVAAANVAGYPLPDPTQILLFGLLEEARRNPLRINPDEAKAVIRSALFDVGPDEKRIEPEDLAYVAKHVRQSLKGHLHDSKEKFEKWLKDERSDLIHRIAKRTDRPLDRVGVRQALIELGWLSMQFLAECITAQMTAFREAFPTPLTPIEKTYYDYFYIGSPEFGNIPFLLLFDRFDYLKPAIFRMWNDPGNQDSPAIILAMLHRFSTLVSDRRAADRRYKQNRGRRARIAAQTCESADQKLFDETARRLVLQQGLDCNLASAVFSLEESNDTRITIRITCSDKSPCTLIHVSRSEFASIAKAVLKDWVSPTDGH